ncbi:MAG: hypothetical protein JXB03_09795 [Spirochaetales bacterium]|nr:hypothetical protein [Spirochaetales bacterium]
METVYDNDHATVKVYPDIKLVHHEIHKFIYGDTFREMMLAGADAFIKFGCTKYLSDDRNNGALRQEDLQWGQDVWEKKILNAGWKTWALCMPEKVLGQMNVKKVFQRYTEMGIETQVFSTPEDAITWLKSK